ncbi:DUF86 domain-containing protein [Clostridium sp. DJ247]|nr:HepT-like ribonuclease domain-containing protein [Clostridium sp. DJ247]MBC2578869.1 DUF86 domain-containing protein [Clostridium sp. DJ247]
MSRDAFEVLYSNKFIDEGLMKNLKSMVGFRNIAVHDYQAVNLNIIKFYSRYQKNVGINLKMNSRIGFD